MPRNCFITLTYDDANLPEDCSLDVRHWQLFAKRVRKSLGRFRFFHCGEYGDLNLRPHYHAILFGLDFREDSSVWKRNRRGEEWRVSPQLTELWGMGHALVADVSFSSAAYVARYCMKKAGGLLAEEVYSRVDPTTGEEWRVRPEYSTQSLKPGIGASWLDRYGDEVYPDDFVVHEGRKFRPPRFYDRKTKEKDESFFDVVQRARVKRAKQFEECHSPDRRKAHEFILDQKLGEKCRPV